MLNCFQLAHALFDPVPFTIIPNTEPVYSLLNSVDFHPQKPIFCIAHTHNNKISLYRIDEELHPTLIQTLEGPSAQLREPQHAVFSPDGQMLVVANWMNRSLNVYLSQKNGFFENNPSHSILLPKALQQSKPHGIAFSPSGQYLAVACGASTEFKNGLALFELIGYRLNPISILKHDQLPGIPKGICFSPDGKNLLVTFSNPSILIFHLNRGRIDPLPKQIIQGIHTRLSRPEDIKLDPGGNYCAVSNSDQNTVTFYSFDKDTNTITDPNPFWVLSNPEAQLTFPHGLAFSSDGSYLAVTQFGQIETTPEGNIIWPKKFPPQEGRVNIYSLCGPL